MVTHFQKLSLGVVGMTMLMVPMTGFAYLTPEQVFGSAEGTPTHGAAGNQPAPPLQREGEQRVSEQQQRSAEQREAAQQELVPTYAEPADTYTPENTQEPMGLFDQNVQYEKRQERIEDAKSDGPTIIIAGDGTVVDSSGNVLHSGAPKISATGPESILAVLAMMLAAVCTFAYVRVKARAITLGALS